MVMSDRAKFAQLVMANECTDQREEAWGPAAPPSVGVPPVEGTSARRVWLEGLGSPPRAEEETREVTLKRRLTLDEALDLLEVETARRQVAEQSLQENEERFRQMSQHWGAFLWLSDAQTKELLYVSPGYEQVWHRTREASYALPQNWLSATIGASTTRVHDKSSRQMQPGADKSEYQVAGPDGALRWIRDRMFPVRDSAGHSLYTLGIAEDVTDLKQLQTTLRQGELRLQALLHAVSDLVFVLRRDGTILDFKPAKEGPLSTPSTELIGKNLNDLLPSPVAGQVMRYLELTLATSQVQTFTCQHLLPEHLRNFEARSVVCGEGEVLAVVRDVTERKRLEKEIIEISSREQQRIGQDLHDGLGQHLTGITFLTKALERKLATKSPTEAAEAAEIGRLVMQALSQTRNLARGLFPVELERDGLMSALQELAGSFERLYRIQCGFTCADSVQVTNNVLATHLFRIVQEALNNSVKHGQARTVSIALAAEGERIVLTIQDDGTGFQPGVRTDGLGLKIMQYRARRIGGSFDIQTGAAGGTTVTVAFRPKPDHT